VGAIPPLTSLAPDNRTEERMAKNSRKNRLDRSHIVCTCDLQHDLNPPRHADHESQCDLWHLEDFMNGLLDWDPMTQSVVTMYPDTFEASEWGEDPTDMQVLVDATIKGYMTASTPGSYTSYRLPSCRHNMTQIRLPDDAGTLIHGSASTDVRGRANGPDYGVYLHGGWSAQSLATFIPWEDYGTPYIPWAQVREVAEDFYRRAQAGQRVEVGCMGGHGRTGTFLACIVLLADPNMTAAGAIAWVRKHYCEKAVEDVSQRHFVAWFADPTLDAFYVHAYAAKATPAVTGGCNWTKKGKACRKEMGHPGSHHYTLPLKAAAAPAAAPVAAKCDATLMDGQYACFKEAGHGANHSYLAVKAWEVSV
jgi:hypothetical protein